MLDKGKIPPQAIDLEEAVLGALLVDERSIAEIGDILMPEMFYKPQHEEIYKTILELYSSGNGIDMLTVANHLKKKGKLEYVGGDFFIIQLSRKVASSAHVEFHTRIVIQKYIQRRLIEKSTDIIGQAYNDENDVLDVLDIAYDNLNQISENAIKTQDALLTELIDIQIDRARQIYKGEIKAGLTTPIGNLTYRTGGWRDSELIILAARPGMGKTAFAIACALHTAKQNIPVAIFSLEMSKEKLTDRILSMESRVDGDKFNIHGLSDLDMEKVEPVKYMLQNLPLYIDDDAGLTITQFQVKAKRIVNKYGVKLIIIDYLQLMSGKTKGNREQEISAISRGLKIVAKNLKIPIIALSQLSRAVETRGGSKRPLLSDLRESGAIEQDADVVGFLFRPEYYGISEWDDYDMEPTEGECEYIIAKNRNGGLVKNRMKFEGKFTLFSDLEERDWRKDIPDFDRQNSSSRDDYDLKEPF